MPIKSKAQWRKFYTLREHDEISDEDLSEWKKGVKYSKLPERRSKTRRNKDEKQNRRRR